LAQEWDYALNSPLTPDQVLYCSTKRFWWRRGDFVWKASAKDRLQKGDCIPRGQLARANKELRLSSTHPELSKQWDLPQNAPLTPDDVTAHFSKKLWWRCERGHTWQTSIRKRLRGDNCPYCSGRRPSPEYCLQALSPELTAQWHPERNGALTPLDVTPGSGKIVWWLCSCGHEWPASISNRYNRGHNCPHCADHTKHYGSVAQERPDLVPEWDPEKNQGSPTDYSARSNKKVWWKCSVCGHSWQTSPDNRFCGSGCPLCAKERRRPHSGPLHYSGTSLN